MGIDKHIILTLSRTPERQWAMLGGSVAMQTPQDKVFFVEGNDGKDYPNMKAAAAAAEADGFPYAHQFAMGLTDNDLSQSVSSVCQIWAISRILRHIAFGTETCLVTLDDRILTLPFPFIDKITTQLQKREEEFYLWQLRVRMGDSYDMRTDNLRICKLYPKLVNDGNVEEYLQLFERDPGVFQEVLREKWVSDWQDFHKAHYEGDEMRLTTSRYIRKYLQKNRLGYDETMIISPKGAAWFLTQAFDMEKLEAKVDYPDDVPHWERVIHRRNTFDSWMISDLDKPVRKAVAAKKGIWCPRQIGYRYIHDWLPMGSTVEWANKSNSEVEDFRNRSSEIQFLDVD